MDSETRSRMKEVLNAFDQKDMEQIASHLDRLVDWVYDQGYRKGWFHGFWRQDADLSYQTVRLSRKRTR